MKFTLKIIPILLLFMNVACNAQQIVQLPKDAYKLKTNEQQFLNKPLKNLLKEIKPEIKTAWATLGEQSYFSFYFTDPEAFKNGSIIEKNNIGLFIYVKEPIDWVFEKRSKDKELFWTKEDAEKYGNLTVIRIKVIGKD
ncbi:hypothetical protein SGQ83_14150 [Flavobacterium sp. Fl-318]|uniref:GLPGLI family protein n=1 Tax=Flavobacterium cupriresistens TaxID=2893885 RepID=A0ABU4RGI3_9FLAO|nr:MULTISPECIES: hypothetical protein [unclassified Flavobacterium]MDX6190500.1 hypothetical protein [Flavobacterium sp. Fl-318]UFH43560.1 hypothetical protein LNP23_04925 [Flavobacterium sp. F-323]